MGSQTAEIYDNYDTSDCVATDEMTRALGTRNESESERVEKSEGVNVGITPDSDPISVCFWYSESQHYRGQSGTPYLSMMTIIRVSYFFAYHRTMHSRWLRPAHSQDGI